MVQVGQLLQCGLFAFVDEIGQPVGGEQAGALPELGQDHDQLGMVGRAVECQFGAQQVVGQDRGELVGAAPGAVGLRMERQLETDGNDDARPVPDCHADRQRVGPCAVHQQPLAQALRRQGRRKRQAGAQALGQGAVGQFHQVAGCEIGGRQVQR